MNTSLLPQSFTGSNRSPDWLMVDRIHHDIIVDVEKMAEHAGEAEKLVGRIAGNMLRLIRQAERSGVKGDLDAELKPIGGNKALRHEEQMTIWCCELTVDRHQHILKELRREIVAVYGMMLMTFEPKHGVPTTTEVDVWLEAHPVGKLVTDWRSYLSEEGRKQAANKPKTLTALKLQLAEMERQNELLVAKLNEGIDAEEVEKRKRAEEERRAAAAWEDTSRKTVLAAARDGTPVTSLDEMHFYVFVGGKHVELSRRWQERIHHAVRELV